MFDQKSFEFQLSDTNLFLDDSVILTLITIIISYGLYRLLFEKKS